MRTLLCFFYFPCAGLPSAHKVNLVENWCSEEYQAMCRYEDAAMATDQITRQASDKQMSMV